MSAKLIERRIEKLETDRRAGNLVVLWAESAEDAEAQEAAARARDPWANALVIRWQS